MMKQAKDGTIWLLRDDIMKTIDFYEATLEITHKQYKRIKDEYEYYISIGGNHDVKERFESFFAKIYGTGEIKMVPDDTVKHWAQKASILERPGEKSGLFHIYHERKSVFP